MSSHLGPKQTLELIENLKTTVRDFAAREVKLSQEYRVKTTAGQNRRDEALEEFNRQLAGETGQADATAHAAREIIQGKFKSRKTVIADAIKTSLKVGFNRIEIKEGGRKHKLQTEIIQNKRHRETGLASAENTQAEFKTALASDQQALAGLEAEACLAFSGYGSLVRLVSAPPAAPEPNLTPDEYDLMTELRALLEKTGGDVKKFQKLLLPAFFKYRWLWLVLALGQIGLVPLFIFLKVAREFTYEIAGASAGGCVLLGLILFFIGKSQAAPGATAIASALGLARKLHDACFEKCEDRRRQEIARVEHEFQTKSDWITSEWRLALDTAEATRIALPGQIDDHAARLSAEHERRFHLNMKRLEDSHRATVDRLTAAIDAQKKAVTDAWAEKEAKITADYEAVWRPLETEWKTKVQPIYQTIAAAHAESEKQFPPWQPELWKDWNPPERFGHIIKFAHLDVDVEQLSEGAPKDARLALPGPAHFALPLLLTFPNQGSVVFETKNSGRDEVVEALNNIVLRLLATAPAGKISLTVIDPVGLGQSFSGVMHLTDYAEHLINSRIWTQTTQIEQRLADLNEHMEKVIQMYLRNEYATIAEYNEQAGNIAEKYHFVVVADFPTAFSDLAAKRLLSIAASGARCGVFTLIHWDRRQPVPQDFLPEELRKSSVCISSRGEDFSLTGNFIPGTNLVLDTPPAPELAISFIQKVGQRSKDSNRIEVPFTHVAPPAADFWTLETTSELRVPIGRSGATKLQYLAIGKGTRQHALLAGKTGSGKSSLFHVIITNLALWCSPEQVEFYLIDFKKGVEFKCYSSKRLPHARVIAIESDREFGLSVLQRLDDELKRRGDMFRKLGVQDIAGYKREGGAESVPRSLLIIDEFQELFVEDDKISQTASLLLDRIVRQGRAFGIHVLLGSQTLGGAYTVARTTLGQMVIRIALQCNEADAYLIMDDNNPAPRLLSRPGEGIYNDTAGTIEGNSPFQAVWLPDEERDTYLVKVAEQARKSGTNYPGPIVFEGNAPSDVRENPVLQKLLEAAAIKQPAAPRTWLGAPNSIKGPTEAIFHRQSGNNLLIVGQRDEATLAIFAVSLISLAAQYRPGAARIILCDGSAPDSPQREFLARIVQAIPHPITFAKQADLPQIMKGLSDEMTSRTGDEHAADAPSTFLFIHGLQKFNKLRFEEDFGFGGGDAGAAPNPAALLNNLICECTRLGFHVIASCDSLNNVNRFLSRKAFSEFELRVLFQMSANDSASLIDSPKASTLGLHRALFYNEQEGHLETFRPYALPTNEWIEQAGQNLARLAK